jgi:HSP20 family protein
MTLIRWKPLRDVTAWNPVSDLSTEFMNMQRDIDRMFERFRGGVVDEGQSSTWLPAVDIVEEADRFVVKVELPGVEKDNVRITLQDDVLTIRGEKKQGSEQKDKNFHRMERAYGLFQRSFTLPASVKCDKIEATYDKGVLSMDLPKVEEARPKEIEVKIK